MFASMWIPIWFTAWFYHTYTVFSHCILLIHFVVGIKFMKFCEMILGLCLENHCQFVLAHPLHNLHLSCGSPFRTMCQSNFTSSITDSTRFLRSRYSHICRKFMWLFLCGYAKVLCYINFCIQNMVLVPSMLGLRIICLAFISWEVIALWYSRYLAFIFLDTIFMFHKLLHFMMNTFYITKWGRNDFDFKIFMQYRITSRYRGSVRGDFRT